MEYDGQVKDTAQRYTVNGKLHKDHTDDRKKFNHEYQDNNVHGNEMINSQIYGFSMRRKQNTETSNPQAGIRTRNFGKYNDLQSSRCQSNISLDSLLTQYRHDKTKNINRNFLAQRILSKNINQNTSTIYVNYFVPSSKSPEDVQHGRIHHKKIASKI